MQLRRKTGNYNKDKRREDFNQIRSSFDQQTKLEGTDRLNWYDELLTIATVANTIDGKGIRRPPRGLWSYARKTLDTDRFRKIIKNQRQRTDLSRWLTSWLQKTSVLITLEPKSQLRIPVDSGRINHLIKLDYGEHKQRVTKTFDAAQHLAAEKYFFKRDARKLNTASRWPMNSQFNW